MESRDKVLNLVMLKLIELSCIASNQYESPIGFEDVLWFYMRNKSKMATKIMELGASSYPFNTLPMMSSLG